MPKLSIISINFNNFQGLEKTIQSVCEQTFLDYEFIVIDGGSTDESRELIEKYAANIYYWVSESDKGIYHAQNKGIAKASGTYCLFLNSGDYFYTSDVLEKVFESKRSEDILYGDMMIDWGNGKITYGKMPDKISVEHMYNDTVWHPVSFIKRKLFEQFGNYDENYKIVSDYDFFFKTIIANNASTLHLPIPIAVYNTQGLSSKEENKLLERDERRSVVEKYLTDEVIKKLEKKKPKKKIEHLVSKLYNWLTHNKWTNDRC